MSRWQRIGTVATFEFLSAVKRRGYLIATFGMPVFMAMYGAVVGLPAYYADKKDSEPSVFGVVDGSGLLHLGGDAKAAVAAIAELPASFREVLLLVAVEGLQPAEAARVCGVTPEALRQRLSRARAMLARALEDTGGSSAPVLSEVTP